MPDRIFEDTAVLAGIDTLSGDPVQLLFSFVAQTCDATAEDDSGMELICRIEYRTANDALFSEAGLSVYDDEVYDILDLSLCLKRLADTSDLTIELPDNQSTRDYAYRAQTCITLTCLDTRFQLLSKDTPKFSGKRFVDCHFDCPSASPLGNSVTVCRLSTSPEAVAKFAEKLGEFFQKADELRESVCRQ